MSFLSSSAVTNNLSLVESQVVKNSQFTRLKEVFGILSPIIQLSSHNEFDPATCYFSALYLHYSGEVHLPMKVKLL